MAGKTDKGLLEKVMKYALDMICTTDELGNFIQISEACHQILGYSPEELAIRPILDFVHAEDLDKTENIIQRVKQGFKTTVFENRMLHKSGKIVPVIWSLVWSEEEKVIFAVGRDATERDQNQALLKGKEELHKVFTEHSSDMLGLLDEQGNYLFVGGSTTRILGYKPEQIVGQNAFSFIHPEDIPRALTSWDSLSTRDHVVVKDFRFKSASGKWKWVETVVSNQLHNPAIKALVVSSRDITDRKLNALKLAESEQRFKSLFENNPDMIVLENREGLLLDANPSMAAFLNLPVEEIVNQPLSSFLPPEVLPTCKRYLEEAFNGKCVRCELSVEDNGTKHIDITKIPVFLQNEVIGVYSILQDVTETKKNQAELKLLSLVANHTKNGVIIKDKEGKIEWANDSFAHISGYPISEILGQKPLQLLKGPKTDLKTLALVNEKIKQGESVSCELLMQKKNGEEVWLAIEINPVFDQDGKVQKLVSTQTDITDKKKGEQESLDLAKDLYRQNRDLQQFTYIVSHNLRAPVANALGLANLMARMGQDEAVYKASMFNLKKSVVQLDTILKDLNLILTIRDNQNSAEKETVKVAEVCRQAIANLEDQLHKCGGEVVLRIDDTYSLSTTKAYLYSIVYNLLSNAIKYRSKHRPLRVEINCFGSPERGTVISFADNGSGMDLAKVGDKVFKLYKRFHQGEGRGIGLYLVKTHVEAMNGKIRVSSQVEKGTRFLIFLK